MRNLITGIWETLFGGVVSDCHDLLLSRIHECNTLQQQIIELQQANADLMSKLQNETERNEKLREHCDDVYLQGIYYFDALKDVRSGIEKIFHSIVRYQNKKFQTDDATPPTSTN